MPEVKAASKTAHKVLKDEDPSYKISLEGEGFLLGGSLVIDKDGKVVFLHQERVFGDVAAPATLLAACKQAAAVAPSLL
jgi:hypothetical protein